MRTIAAIVSLLLIVSLAGCGTSVGGSANIDNEHDSRGVLTDTLRF